MEQFLINFIYTATAHDNAWQRKVSQEAMKTRMQFRRWYHKQFPNW